MKKLIFFILILLFFNTVSKANSKSVTTIHCLFGSTNSDENLNAETVEERFRGYWDNPGDLINYQVPTPKALLGKEFNLSNLDEAIDELLAKVKPNDVVFIHLYDHAVAGNSRFPVLQIYENEKSILPQNKLDPDKRIFSKLSGKVKFLLVFVDGCRDLKGMPSTTENVRNPDRQTSLSMEISKIVAAPYSKAFRTKKKYKGIPYSLFLNMSGSIGISSTKPSQSAYFLPSQGGFGSFQFYKALEEAKGEKQVNWLDVLDKFGSRTEAMTNNLFSQNQTPVWFGRINGQYIGDDRVFYPANDTLNHSITFFLKDKLKKKYSDRLIIDKARSVVREFGSAVNNKRFYDKNFEEITINPRKFPHFNDYAVEDPGYILLSQYTELSKRKPLRNRNRTARQQNHLIGLTDGGKNFKIRNIKFDLDSIQFKGVWVDSIITNKPLFLFELPKNVSFQNKETRRDSTISYTQLVGLELRIPRVRLRPKFFKILVNRVVALPNLHEQAIEEPLESPPPMKPKMKVILKKANDFYSQHAIYIVSDFFNLMRFVAENYQDDSMLDSAIVLSKGLFQNIEQDTLVTTWLDESDSLKILRSPVKKQLEKYFEKFPSWYPEKVTYEFCDSREKVFDYFDDEEIFLVEVEKDKKWVGSFEFNQNFRGFFKEPMKKSEKVVDRNFDHTRKRMKIMVELIGDSENEYPEFKIYLKSVEHIRTLKVDNCNLATP